MKDSLSTKARVYAQTLLEVADEKRTVEEVGRALVALAEHFAKDPSILSFFRTAAISAREKRRVVESAFSPAKGVPVHLYNFLRVLADRHDLGVLPTIAIEWRRLLDERAGRIRFKVYTARPIDEPELGSIAQAVGEVLRKEAIPEAVVEEDLLGGVVLQIEDVRIDGSVKTRLQRLRARLMESLTL